MSELLITLKLTLIVYVFTAIGEPDMIFAWYQKLIGKLPNYLYFPLGGCHKCMTGQVLFWYHLIIGTYFLDLFFYVSLGIFTSILFDKIWQTLES